jgi:hypothetical protein
VHPAKLQAIVDILEQLRGDLDGVGLQCIGIAARSDLVEEIRASNHPSAARVATLLNQARAEPVNTNNFALTAGIEILAQLGNALAGLRSAGVHLDVPEQVASAVKASGHASSELIADALGPNEPGPA